MRRRPFAVAKDIEIDHTKKKYTDAGGRARRFVIQGVNAVTKTVTKKVWTKPTLARLGTIADVAGASAGICQQLNGGGVNCPGNQQGFS